MKKFIIALAIIATTGITALSVAKTFQPASKKSITVSNTEFLKKDFNAPKNDVSSID